MARRIAASPSFFHFVFDNQGFAFDFFVDFFDGFNSVRGFSLILYLSTTTLSYTVILLFWLLFVFEFLMDFFDGFNFVILLFVVDDDPADDLDDAIDRRSNTVIGVGPSSLTLYLPTAFS